jgi:putative DNA primase/helicase
VITPGNIPRELRDREQWVVWRIETRGGKDTKVPFSVAGGHAKANDPSTWSSFTEAVVAAGNGYDGVGYVFAPDDPYAGIDLDDCRDKDTGELHDEARRIIDELASYTEVSPSEQGVKIIVRASKPGDRFRTGKTPWHGDIELYDRERYFTITGASLNGPEIADAQDALDAVYARYFPSEGKDAKDDAATPQRPADEDADVLDRAMNLSHFRRLYSGDVEKYASGSEGDLALCATLASITDDRDQVERIWRTSGLWRPKCDDRPDYVTSTIDKAFLDTRPDFADLDLLNDVGNAKRLVAEHGHDILFAPAFGWLVWTGTRWQPDATGDAMRRAKTSAERLFKSVPRMNITDDRYRNKLSRFANNSMSSSKLSATLSLAETEAKVRRTNELFDTQPHRLNLLNGTLDLRTRELREHDRNDLVTRLAPVEYDPEATSEAWNGFLTRILPDDELRAFVQRCAGYSCAGAPVEKYLMFAHGPQDTGKSTFLKALEDTLGDYAQTADFETFLAKKGGHGTRNDIARMRGARLIKSLEVDEGEKLAAGVIKAMTGGDTIAARFLYREHFEFVMEGVLWLAANARPKVDANDDAMWRRILHVPFLVSIPKAEQDRSLGEKLKQPDAQRAILRWLVDGYTAYIERGIDVPAVVRAYTDEYRHEQNPLAGFFDTKVELESRSWLPWQDIRDLVQGWADDERVRMPSDPEIKAALRAAGCRDERKREDGKLMRGWTGLRPVPDDA